MLSLSNAVVVSPSDASVSCCISFSSVDESEGSTAVFMSISPVGRHPMSCRPIGDRTVDGVQLGVVEG